MMNVRTAVAALALLAPLTASAGWAAGWAENFDVYNVADLGAEPGWSKGFSTGTWDTRSTAAWPGGVNSTLDNNTGGVGYGTNTGVDNYLLRTAHLLQDFQLDVRFISRDDDAVGVVFRYVNGQNFHLLYFSQNAVPRFGGGGGGNWGDDGGVTLYEVRNGIVTTHWRTAGAANCYTVNAATATRVQAEGGRVQVWLDRNNDGTFASGELVMDASSVAIATGTVGLYQHSNGANGGVSWDDLIVRLPDFDDDGVPDEADNCSRVANPNQADLDGDKLGDACDDDADGDGAAKTEDCDDLNAARSPRLAEICDGIDNDCNTVIDDNATGAATYYRDADADGRGNPLLTQVSCSPPSGHVLLAGDCDDNDSARFPGNPEICDGKDNDCNTLVDDNATNASTWYADNDGDTYGNLSQVQRACAKPTGFVASSSDCNDNAAAINPAAPERCDGIDNNCDGRTDGDDATDRTTWYADADNDGSGNPAVTALACVRPSGHVANANDCNDGNANIRPGAPEVCNGVDDDCDGATDEGTVTQSWWPDADSDGFGSASATPRVDCRQPAGHVNNNGDCDDVRASVRPGADERCNLIDDDCDGAVDEAAVDAPTWYADADRDAFPDSETSTRACARPSGYAPPHVSGQWDCDDSVASIRPGAPELCNEVDDNCDGFVDETSVPVQWYVDADGDGYGDPGEARELQCVPPGGDRVPNRDDCDDDDDEIYPGASEYCDGVDNDCDDQTDEPDAVDTRPWYQDADGDGYGASNAAAPRRCAAPAAGWVDQDGDCAPGDVDINPGATEVCDGLDNDCDGLVDDEPSDGAPTWPDADGDGFADDTQAPFQACEAPAGTSQVPGDCDDDDPERNPDATEVPGDDIDQDCDGTDGINEPPRPFDPLNTDTSVSEQGPQGCACTSVGRPAGWAWAVVGLGLLSLRRRR